MIKIIYFLIALSSFLLAENVDYCGRTLNDHEKDGGHTIARHVGKSNDYLRQRCRKLKIKKEKNISSFSSQKQAEEKIKNILKKTANLTKIGVLSAYKTNDKKTEVFNQLDSYNAKGINCDLVDKYENKYFIKFRRNYKYLLLCLLAIRTSPAQMATCVGATLIGYDRKKILVDDTFSYFNKTQLVVKIDFNKANNWYLLTAYPTIKK